MSARVDVWKEKHSVYRDQRHIHLNWMSIECEWIYTIELSSKSVKLPNKHERGSMKGLKMKARAEHLSKCSPEKTAMVGSGVANVFSFTCVRNFLSASVCILIFLLCIASSFPPHPFRSRATGENVATEYTHRPKYLSLVRGSQLIFTYSYSMCLCLCVCAHLKSDVQWTLSNVFTLGT